MMNKKRKRYDPQQEVDNKWIRIFNYILLILVTVVIVFPILIIVFTAFKENKEYMMTSPLKLPESFLNFDNFVNVLKKGNFATGLKNSLILITIPTAISVFTGTLAAFVCSRFEFKFRKIFIGMIILASFIPIALNQIPTFMLIKNLGVYNTIWAGILLYSGAGVMDLFIFLQGLDKIPKSIDESGIIEGASYPQIYSKLVFPLMKPAVATVVILKIFTIYNDMLMPTLMMPGKELKTMTTAFMAFVGDKGSQWNVVSAAVFIVLIPTFVLFLIAQKQIYSGIMGGSVKE